ncbi:hypothetical protein T4D_14673 [Trichinella pseudospiralis]|uniref:CCHC-type domain-containing protein n=1 Tax=Trichinella pseudospiralis TaxID=6337 RepID=A0A0V1G486_TRIPS|nr:hypothetical protein T4D_14673 [Trichinella pseudospiralis]
MASAANSEKKKQETSCPQRSVEPVEEQVSLMEETFRAADALQTEVELDFEGEERQAAIDDWALCRQNYRVGKARAHARMVEARGEGPIGGGNCGRPVIRASNGRLPEVTLPKFTGEVLEFPFGPSSRPGTARNAIEEIPLTPENYTQAVDILKKRFGRPRLVIREHLAAFDEAFALSRSTGPGSIFRLPSLKRGPDADVAGQVPPALIRTWDTNIGSDATEDEDNLQKFLEFAQWQAGLLSKLKREDTKPSAARSTAAALAVVAAKSCPFCIGEHSAEDCGKFLQADLSRRRDMVRAKEVCFRCLGTGHWAKGCREGRPCGVDGCRQQHHKLLHPSSTTESARSPRSDRARQDRSSPASQVGNCGAERCSSNANRLRSTVEEAWCPIAFYGTSDPRQRSEKVEAKAESVCLDRRKCHRLHLHVTVVASWTTERLAPPTTTTDVDSVSGLDTGKECANPASYRHGS